MGSFDGTRARMRSPTEANVHSSGVVEKKDARTESFFDSCRADAAVLPLG